MDELLEDYLLKCNICHTEFDVDKEGGIDGCIGTFITFAMCPFCYNGIRDMFDVCGSDYCDEEELEDTA